MTSVVRGIIEGWRHRHRARLASHEEEGSSDVKLSERGTRRSIIHCGTIFINVNDTPSRGSSPLPWTRGCFEAASLQPASTTPHSVWYLKFSQGNDSVYAQCLMCTFVCFCKVAFLLTPHRKWLMLEMLPTCNNMLNLFGT